MLIDFLNAVLPKGRRVKDLKTIKGNRDYDISPVYVIGILGVEYFDRSDAHWRDNFISDYTFREKSTAEVICETISLIFVELKRFDKALEDCKDIIDKWCYALKHMSKLDSLPIELQNRIFR